MRIFLMCGAFVGVTGTLIGTDHRRACSAGTSWRSSTRWRISPVAGFSIPSVFYADRICPTSVDWHDVAQVVVLGLVLSLLATLYPSWRAARTDPVEALRHE